MPHVNVVLLHSADKVQGYLDEALRIVTELEISDDLRPTAFTLAVQLLTAHVPLVTDDVPVPMGMLSPSIRGKH